MAAVVAVAEGGPAGEIVEEHFLRHETTSASGKESMVIDIGPALQRAREAVQKGEGSQEGSSALKVERQGPLTTPHQAVRHLDVCEAKHCWRWVPDQKLSAFWNELPPEERARVVETHAQGVAVRKFCKEMNDLVRPKDCRAGEKAKKSLGAVFMLDQHSLSIYKEMFVVAVEQNVPLAINMEVIEAVDAVVQDFCAARRQNEGRQCGYLDPRKFPEGSDLWVQYREREHIRLVWMSTMAKVFEIRLLQRWESRHGSEEREAARQAALRAATELLQLEERGEVRAVGSAKPASPSSAEATKERRKRQRARRKEALREAQGELEAAQSRVDGAQDCDEIDAEFNRRVLEHLKARAEEAKRNNVHSQTERGNQILKALCEKLKAQLEVQVQAQ